MWQRSLTQALFESALNPNECLFHQSRHVFIVYIVSLDVPFRWLLQECFMQLIVEAYRELLDVGVSHGVEKEGFEIQGAFFLELGEDVVQAAGLAGSWVTTEVEQA